MRRCRGARTIVAVADIEDEQRGQHTFFPTTLDELIPEAAGAADHNAYRRREFTRVASAEEIAEALLFAATNTYTSSEDNRL